MKEKKLFGFFLRYMLLILLAIPNLYIFYFIFTPLTIYPVYFLFNLFFNTAISGNLIYVGTFSIIEIIRACVIGSAYYLLLILNLSTPNIKLNKRIKLILYSFGTLLIVNILRIFLLGLMHVSKSNLFAISHKLLWYFGSIFLVALIWFYQVKKFKIKSIPFYTDIEYLLIHTRPKKVKKSKRSK